MGGVIYFLFCLASVPLQMRSSGGPYLCSSLCVFCVAVMWLSCQRAAEEPLHEKQNNFPRHWPVIILFRAEARKLCGSHCVCLYVALLLQGSVQFWGL